LKRAVRAAVEGLRAAFRCRRVLLALALVNLAMALAVVVPIGRAWNSVMGHQFDSAALAQQWDWALGGDLARSFPGMAGRGAGVLAATVFFSWVLGAFVAGGWLEIFHAYEGRPGLRRFCTGAGSTYGRFLRLGVVNLIAFALVGWMLRGGGWDMFQAFWWGSQDKADLNTEWMAEGLSWLQSAAYLGAISAVLVASDLAKVGCIVRGGRSMVAAFVRGLRIASVHPGRAFGVVWTIYAIEIGVAWVMARVWISLSPAAVSWWGILALFVLAQIWMMLRCGLRGARLAGLYRIWQDAQPTATPVPVTYTGEAGQ